MKKNAATAVLLSAAMLGCATGCSGNSPASAHEVSGSTAPQVQPAALTAIAPTSSASTASAPTASASTSSAPASSAPTTAAAPTDAPTSPSASPSATPTWSALPARWLTPSQLPLDGSLRWTGGAASTALSGVDLMSQTPILYPCADAADGYPTFSKDVVGFAMNGFTANGDVSAAHFDGTPHAVQEYVRYRSTSAARAAYAALEQDVAQCSTLKDMTDVHKVPSTQVTTTTATLTDAVAYTVILRTDQGKPAQVDGNYSGASDYHVYIVRSGNLVEVVYLAGGAAVDESGHDAASLGMLVDALG